MLPILLITLLLNSEYLETGANQFRFWTFLILSIKGQLMAV